MEDSAGPQARRAADVAALDAGRDTFLAAFATAPDAALAYVPPGDEYALGALLLHVRDPLLNYADLMSRLAGAGPEPLDARAPERAAAQHATWTTARPTPEERPSLLAALEAAHQQFRARLLTVADADYDRLIPVLYTGSDEPYPTSPHLVAGWVIDHYQEHIPQIEAMVRDWQAAPPAG